MRVLACIPTKRQPAVFMENMDYVFRTCPAECEFLVINNGGNPQDFRPEVFGDRRVRVLHIPVNVGHAAAVNHGIYHLLSWGHDFFLLMDDDATILTPDWYPKCLALMDHDPRVGVVGGKILNPDGQTVQYARMRISTREITQHLDEPRHKEVLNRISRVVCCPAIFNFHRASCIRKVGYFDILFSPGQGDDIDYCTRICLQGFSCVYHGGIEILHRQYFSQDDPQRALYLAVSYYALKRKYNGYMALADKLDDEIEKTGRDIVLS